MPVTQEQLDYIEVSDIIRRICGPMREQYIDEPICIEQSLVEKLKRSETMSVYDRDGNIIGVQRSGV